ncbi:MAG: hypothetical protein VCA36_02475, partial [Opitutales bacterium]
MTEEQPNKGPSRAAEIAVMLGFGAILAILVYILYTGPDEKPETENGKTEEPSTSGVDKSKDPKTPVTVKGDPLSQSKNPPDTLQPGTPTQLSPYKPKGFKYEASLEMELEGSGKKTEWEVFHKEAQFQYQLYLKWEGEVIRNDGQWYTEKRAFQEAQSHYLITAKDFGLTDTAKNLLSTLQLLFADPTVFAVSTAFRTFVDLGKIKDELTKIKTQLPLLKGLVERAEKQFDELAAQNVELASIGYAAKRFENLAGSTVEVTWYKGKLYKIRPLSKVTLSSREEALASKLAGFVDYNVLPVDEMEVGDDWRVPVARVVDYFSPGGYTGSSFS